jgi:hypothetical protein
VGSVQGFKKGGHHVILVADVQGEVVQGSMKGQLWGHHRAAGMTGHGRPAGQHCRRAGQGVWQLPGRGGVVVSGRVFGSTQCLRKLHKKFL